MECCIVIRLATDHSPKPERKICLAPSLPGMSRERNMDMEERPFMHHVDALCSVALDYLHHLACDTRYCYLP